MADNEQNTTPQTPAAPGEKAKVVQTKSPIRQERWKPIAKKPLKEVLKKQPIYIPEEDQETSAGEAPMEDFEQKVEAKPEEGLPPRQQQDQQQAQQQAMPQMPSFPSYSRSAPFSGTKSAGKDLEKEETPKGKGEFRVPKIPERIKSVAKDVGSNAGIAFKKTSSRVASAASRGIGSGIGKAGNLAAKAGNFGINAASNFSSQFTGRPFIGGMSKKYLLLLLLFMALMLFFLTGAAPQPTPPIGTSPGDISQCFFYRGGDSIDGLKYQNPQLPQLITEISNKVGVPPAIIAAIMRVESPRAFADPASSNYVSNDYEAKFSQDAAGNPIAYGIMQFTPGTFQGVFNSNSAELQSLFGKTSFTIAIDPQGAMAPTSVFRIYSIRDSITAAAFKVRADKQVINGSGPWDENTINQIAEKYYGCLLYPSCLTGPYSYGGDLFKSYSSCIATTPILANVSCPLPNPQISCASYGPLATWGGFSGICSVDTATGIGGHCSPNYQAATGYCSTLQSNGNLLRTAKGIDIVNAQTAPGQTVYLPTINGQNLTWSYKGSVSAGSVGYIRLFESGATAQGVWSIQFTHVNPSDPPLVTGATLTSGQAAATLYDQGSNTHLHINIGVNVGDSLIDLQNYSSGWVFPDRDLRMCII